MNPLLKLIAHGQSYWLDNLTRRMIRSGELQRRVSDQGLRGVTTNPAIFENAVRGSHDYDEQIDAMAAIGASSQEIYEALVISDVQAACDILRPVYDASEGVDGYVSLEVSPHLAHDSQGSIEEARRLFERVERPNLFIKIPATQAGLVAIEELVYKGIPVNITLLFSAPRYGEVAEAYLRALQRRHANGSQLPVCASVASFFLSRIDTLVDQLLEQRISPGTATGDGTRPADLRGRVAVANAKLAYQQFRQLLAGERWQVLADQGARVQRMLWASTSTKHPHYSDVLYVEPLIGPDTVNTLTETTINAFADHGTVATTLEQDVEQSRQVMDALAALGIDFQLVSEQLINEGLQKFITPYDALLERLAVRCRHYRHRHAARPLEQMARQLRRQVLRMTSQAGSGHPTSCLSCAEIVAALFFHDMRWDPHAPAARDVDQFILSKGHAAPILWAALAAAGALPEDDFLSLRRFDSRLEGHPTPANPWIRVATGSLGQGLAAANGIALANRLDGIDARVYCLLGDAECSEGAVWEAAQFASLQHLDQLIAIVDVNGLGQSGPTPYHHDSSVLARRFESFGWQTAQIDGHDPLAILDALASARGNGPFAILARTIKGKGVSFLEGKQGWHGKPLDQDALAQALGELGEAEFEMAVPSRRVEQDVVIHAEPAPLHIEVEYPPDQAVATRAAFGQALCKLGEQCRDLVVLDGDVMNSTYTEYFAEALPERFFQGHIAEQNLVGTALGLAACGKRPVVATFAAFLGRAADFIRMAGHSHPAHLVLCGSHAGVSIGEDGPSQMGLEDLALMRAVIGSQVFYPCDAVSAERLTELALETPGIVYLRTTRPKTPLLYGNTDRFVAGGSHTLRRSDQDRLTLVAAGITVHEALAAWALLRERGIAARVIDCYSVKPLDVDNLRRAAQETGILIVVEDHYPEGGLGEAVAAVVEGNALVQGLAVRRQPHSGTQTELLAMEQIDRHAIVAKALELSEHRQQIRA